MTSPLCVATGGWCRRVFHYRPPTPMYRNSPPLCTIVLQIPSLMPLKMRKVQLRECNLNEDRLYLESINALNEQVDLSETEPFAIEELLNRGKEGNRRKLDSRLT